MTLDDLLRLAAEATPGPWKSILPGDLSWKDRRSYRCVAFSRKRDERYTTSPLLPLDAAHIAAFSPEVAAALVKVAMAAGRLLHDQMSEAGRCPACGGTGVAWDWPEWTDFRDGLAALDAVLAARP